MNKLKTLQQKNYNCKNIFQLQLFLQHQNIKQTNELPEELEETCKVEKRKEEEKKVKEEEDNTKKIDASSSTPQQVKETKDPEVTAQHEMSCKVLSVQEKQQQQLNALQLQVRAQLNQFQPF